MGKKHFPATQKGTFPGPLLTLKSTHGPTEGINIDDLEQP